MQLHKSMYEPTKTKKVHFQNVTVEISCAERVHKKWQPKMKVPFTRNLPSDHKTPPQLLWQSHFTHLCQPWSTGMREKKWEWLQFWSWVHLHTWRRLALPTLPPASSVHFAGMPVSDLWHTPAPPSASQRTTSLLRFPVHGYRPAADAAGPLAAALPRSLPPAQRTMWIKLHAGNCKSNVCTNTDTINRDVQWSESHATNGDAITFIYCRKLNVLISSVISTADNTVNWVSWQSLLITFHYYSATLANQYTVTITHPDKPAV